MDIHDLIGHDNEAAARAREIVKRNMLSKQDADRLRAQPLSDAFRTPALQQVNEIAMSTPGPQTMHGLMQEVVNLSFEGMDPELRRAVQLHDRCEVDSRYGRACNDLANARLDAEHGTAGPLDAARQGFDAAARARRFVYGR